MADALLAWRAAVAPDNTAPRFADTLNAANDTLTAISQGLAPFGIAESGEARRAPDAK